MTELLFLLAGIVLVAVAAFVEIEAEYWLALLLGVLGGAIVGLQLARVLAARERPTR